jgi:hypothetical protein
VHALLERMEPLSAPRPLWPYLAFAAPKREPFSTLPPGKLSRQRSQRQASRRVLFLDFDGVLHPGPAPLNIADQQLYLPTTHFGWLPTLLSVLRPHPDVGVVVHSSWRLNYDEDELREILSDVGDRYLGATPPGERYASILQWLAANSDVTSYRVLDDEPDEFPLPVPEEVILCDPTMGVNGVEVVAALRKWLSG